MADLFSADTGAGGTQALVGGEVPDGLLAGGELADEGTARRVDRGLSGERTACHARGGSQDAHATPR